MGEDGGAWKGVFAVARALEKNRGMLSDVDALHL